MTATLETTQLCQLAEIAFGTSESRVDPERGIIHGVRIVGLQSGNTGKTIGLSRREFGDAVDLPYSYSPKALQEATGKYEGVGVYVDHAGFEHKPDGSRAVVRRDRGTAERFGRLKNVRFNESGLVGDLEFLKAHPLAPLVVEAAQRMPEMLGLSHDAAGKPKLINGKIVIVEIDSVSSVDLIGAKPGTTRGLFESKANTKGPSTVKLTLKQLLEAADPQAPSKPLLARLLELDAPMGDVGVELMAEQIPTAEKPAAEEQLKSGLLAAVVAKLEKAKGEEWTAVLAALGLSDSVADIVTGKKGAEGGEEKKETPESLATAKAAGKTEAKSTLLECVALLVGACQPVKTVWLESMELLETKEKRQAFVDELPKPTGAGITPRSQSPHKQITESASGKGQPVDLSDPGKGIAALRGR